MDSVEEVLVERVEIGDTIWCQDDGAWLTVARIERERGLVTFYRADNSLAEVEEGFCVLVRR